MSDCPGCGRFVGPHEACPYCGAALAPRLSIRILKYGALALAAVGLLTLLLFAGRSQAPLYPIGDFNPTMNFAYVRVAGTVSRQPGYDPEDGSLDFWLDDGTGELYVGLYHKEAEALLAAGAVPHLGDQVQVDGTLRLREDFGSLTVNAPESVVVARPQPEPVEIGALAADWAGRPVQVMGVVRQVRQPYPGLTIVELRDATGAVEVTIPQEVIHLTGEVDPAALTIGASLQVEGVVVLYNESPQIALTDAAGATQLPFRVEFAPTQTIGDIGHESLGRFTHLLGAVTAVKPFSAGVKLTLDDGSGTITVLLWQNLAELVTAHTPLEPGMQLAVVGEIAEYRSEMEIIPEISADVKITGRATPTPGPTATPTATPSPSPTLTVIPLHTPAATPSSTATPTSAPSPTPLPTIATAALPTQPPITPLESISIANVGQTISVQANVSAASSFSAGFKFTLDDGSGQIVLLLWTDLYAQVDGRSGLRPGAAVRVTGEVGEYQGELQLEPYPEDVVILAAGNGPAAPAVATDSLGPYKGQIVAIQGTIVRLTGFSGNGRLVVDDGSGEAQVILWKNVLGLVPAELLAPGAQVRVIGTVGEYRSNVQLVPALPVYVQNIPPASGESNIPPPGENQTSPPQAQRSGGDAPKGQGGPMTNYPSSPPCQCTCKTSLPSAENQTSPRRGRTKPPPRKRSAAGGMPRRGRGGQ